MMNIAESSRYLSQVNIENAKARLLQHSEPPKLEIRRDKGGLEMRSDPVKLDLDNRAFFDSLGLKSIKALAQEMVDKCKKNVLDSMANSAREADMLSSPHVKNAISEIAVMKAGKNIETMLAFIPESPPECNWTGGTLEIKYTPDKLTFDWDIKDIEMTYIPYKVEFEVID